MENTVQSTSPSTQVSELVALLQTAAKIRVEEVPSPDSRDFYISIPVPKAPVPAEPTADMPAADAPIEYLLANAQILLGHQDFVLARNLYSHILRQDLKNEQALKGLGTCFRALGDLSSAKRCFRAVQELFGKQEPFVWLAQIYFQEKNEDEALRTLKRIKNPELMTPADRNEYYKELGNCYFRRNEMMEAEKTFRAGLEYSPSCDTLLASLGMLEIQSGHYEIAAGYLLRALENNPRNAKACAGLGSIAVEANQLARAYALLNQALDMDHQNRLALYQLVAISEHIPELEAIQKRLIRALDSTPQDADLRFLFATMLLKENNWRACERELDRILSQCPDHKRAIRLKADLLTTRAQH